MTCPLLRVFRTRVLRPVRILAAALAVGWFLPLALAAGTSTTPIPGDAGSARPTTFPGADPKGVLILSGVQFGLPVSGALIAGTVTALKDKGVSINDIYVEMLDLVRNEDPRWRAALASLLRDKFAKRNIGLVMALNQAALDFLAQEGDDLAPPGTPVLSALIAKPAVAWRGTPRPVMNIIQRWDITGTLRYGLALFPRTRRVLVVAGADDLSSSFFARAAEALAALPGQREIEDTAALSHAEMLQRISALPPDTLVLLGIYYKDRTGRPFIPAEVAAAVAQRANAPVLALYDVHIREGLTGGSVVPTATVGRRAGEIGFDLLTGVRQLTADDADATVPPQPLFDWSQLQRWGADPAQLPADTRFLNRPRTIWNDYRDAVITASAVMLALTTLVVALAVENRRRKRTQARVEYLAYYDALTGLPNRLLGLDRLTQTLDQVERHQRALALLYLDLDRFKHINDRHGHLQGDRLLRQLSQRLARRLRAEDTLCRLGADEFMLVLPEVRGERSLTDLARLCERLIALGREPYDLDGHQVYVDLSIGVALYPRDGADGETLMRHADIALQAAKRAGRQTYRFFEPGMNAALTRFIETREALRMALECEEFVVHYQPQIDLRTGRLVGVEALVRWQRPEVGLVMPGAFIDVAEESGLIVPLGRWVLVEACRQAAAWRASGWPDLVMAVNVSAAQFRHARIGAEVLAVLAATGLAPAGLEMELTESLLMEGQEAALATVAQWQARGIQLAIDDFGTGYSSLAYLKRFAVDRLKIDRSFVAGMAEHDADRAIVQAIIDLAGGLKLRTLAEGVEDAELAAQLQRMGCDEAQGYLYAKPLPAADLERWLRERGKG